MARREDGSGVGRGNGPGSVKGQFKAGMPSGNPKGRPRKPKPEPDISFREAAHQELSSLVEIREAGVTKWIPAPLAMLRSMMAGFHKQTPRNQTMIVKLLMELAPSSMQERSQLPPAEAIEEFVAKLAEEHRRNMEAEQQFGSGRIKPR